jgi:AraC-like DNA-binding protein
MIYQSPKLQHREIELPILEQLIRKSLPLLPGEFRAPGLDWRVERLQMFIDHQQGKLGLNLNNMCKHLDLGVSGSHGARLFKLQTGLGIREYAKNKRLTSAAEKLRNTTLSVKEIAADLGYRSQSDLARPFKQLFSMNPKEFRVVHRRAPRDKESSVRTSAHFSAE